MDDIEFLKTLPKKRMGAGVLFFNEAGELLIVKPSYKDHWSIPGGVVDKDESPRQACIREVKEEIGLDIKDLKFLGIEYKSSQGEKEENLQFLFHGGKLTSEQIQSIKVDGEEIVEYRFEKVEDLSAFKPNLANRVAEVLKPLNDNSGGIYLENGE